MRELDFEVMRFGDGNIIMGEFGGKKMELTSCFSWYSAFSSSLGCSNFVIRACCWESSLW